MKTTKHDLVELKHRIDSRHQLSASDNPRKVQGGSPKLVASTASPQLLPVPDLNRPEGVTSIGKTIVIKGTLQAGEHLILDGKIEGEIIAPKHDVAISQSAYVRADITANTVTVSGTTKGRLDASNRVELRASANVRGTITAPRVAITGGSKFQGAVVSHAKDILTNKTTPDS
jgi:cytoskeletal protein CcmA (bactofilin family)